MILFTMSLGMSLEKWNTVGMINRELDYLNHLSKKTGPIKIISYGKSIKHVLS